MSTLLFYNSSLYYKSLKLSVKHLEMLTTWDNPNFEIRLAFLPLAPDKIYKNVDIVTV